MSPSSCSTECAVAASAQGPALSEEAASAQGPVLSEVAASAQGLALSEVAASAQGPAHDHLGNGSGFAKEKQTLPCSPSADNKGRLGFEEAWRSSLARRRG